MKNREDIKTAVIVLLAVIITFYLLKKIKEGVQNTLSDVTGGLINNVDEQKASEEVNKMEEKAKMYFSPKYWQKSKAGSHLLTVADSLNRAKWIYDSVGFFSNDGSKAWDVIKYLKYKTQLSFLADQFYKKYKKNMWNYIQQLDDRKDIGHSINPFANGTDFVYYNNIINHVAKNLK